MRFYGLSTTYTQVQQLSEFCDPRLVYASFLPRYKPAIPNV